MRSVAIDIGSRKLSYCEVAGGEVISRHTVSDIRHLESELGACQPSARVAIEACREAWFIYDLLEEWGNEPVLVDTTRSKQLGIGRGRKTDRIDAEILAHAMERGGDPSGACPVAIAS